MTIYPRTLLPFVLAIASALVGCASAPPTAITPLVASKPAVAASAPAPDGTCASTATDEQVRKVLAPTGTLRVGVYAGSPTSMVVDPKSGDKAGLALDLGRALGKHLEIPVQIVEFARLALVLEALKAGQIDFTFTNATPARAKDMDFTVPFVQLELGYLVPVRSRMTKITDVDQSGVRVGVSQGSTSQAALAQIYANASLVPANSIKQAQELLQERKIDAFATNKGILFEMLDSMPNYRILDGRWGVENLAIAVPQGRPLAASYMQLYALQIRKNGVLQSALKKSGLRGTAQGL